MGTETNAFYPVEDLSKLLEDPQIVDKLDRYGFAGLVRGLKLQHPDSPVWTSQVGEGAIQTAEQILSADAGEPPQTAEWNQYYGMLWLAGHDTAALAELIRRAKHRDGSTQSIVTSSGALALLSELEADPPTAAELASLGWSSTAVSFGYHPPGQPVPITSNVAGAPGSVLMPSGDVVAAQAPAAPAVPAPPVQFDGEAKADLSAGHVTIGGAFLSITNAIRLQDSLTVAVRSLLLPGEGYVWVDLTYDPKHSSSLCVLDGELAAGLPIAPDSPGSALKAEVLQDDDGSYTARIYGSDGSVKRVHGTPYTDINEVKFAVAREVRGF